MPQPAFEVLDVSGWEVAADEPAGQEEKLWLLRPGTGEKWLFKPFVEKNGFRQGEDWSEKLSCHLAGLMSLPCADVELAIRAGRGGSLSRNLRPQGWEMQSGLILLSARVPGYQGGDQGVKGRPGHSLQNIQKVLADAKPPPGEALPVGFTAFDVFAGYLTLDAWIANRDRHDENWSILLPGPPLDAGEPLRLCGSYDQAGGLGYNVSDDKRARLLAEPDGVRRWVSKGTAYRFEHDPRGKPVTLVELARSALGMASKEAKEYWLQKVRQITQSEMEALVSMVPKLSEPCRTFVCEVLRVNRERVLDACD